MQNPCLPRDRQDCEVRPDAGEGWLPGKGPVLPQPPCPSLPEPRTALEQLALGRTGTTGTSRGGLRKARELCPHFQKGGAWATFPPLAQGTAWCPSFPLSSRKRRPGNWVSGGRTEPGRRQPFLHFTREANAQKPEGEGPLGLVWGPSQCCCILAADRARAHQGAKGAAVRPCVLGAHQGRAVSGQGQET